jgi:hypothetical protein
MITHEMQTKAVHVTGFYKYKEHLDNAVAGPYPSMKVMQMAHVVYDHKERKFTKCRHTGNTELLNAMLLIERNRHSISDEMWEAVNHVHSQC